MDDKSLTVLINTMKEELNKQTIEITENITRNLTIKMDEKLEPIIKENEALKEEIEHLRSKLNMLDGNSRRNNLILHGVEENETSTGELLENTTEIIKEVIGNIGKNDINRIHRIGKKQIIGKSRPILISLTTNWKRNDILRNKKKLKLKQINITEDFSKETLNKRRELQTEMEIERQKGNYAIIKYDKLIVKENKITGKRQRSISPDPKSNYKVTGPNKLNKIDAFKYMRIRSHSTSEKPCSSIKKD